MHDDLTLYDADAGVHTVRAFDGESVFTVADWIESHCRERCASYALRVDMHRMHGTLRARGVTDTHTLCKRLAEHLHRVTLTRTRADLFTEGTADGAGTDAMHW